MFWSSLACFHGDCSLRCPHKTKTFRCRVSDCRKLVSVSRKGAQRRVSFIRARGVVFKVRGPITSWSVVEVGVNRSGGVVVAFWTLKMVYLVPTQCFLIELQLINHFFNSLTNDKESVTKECNHAQCSIIVFAFHSLQRLPVPSLRSLRLFRTFL